MSDFSLSGVLRRIRRRVDLSQRQLADAMQVSQSAIAQAESGRRDLPVGDLVRAAELAGLRLALLDTEGHEVSGMNGDGVRDLGYRRFPAHLDTRYSDAEWYQPLRKDRPEPWYTFDRDREVRDRLREREGTPPDHQLPQAEDSPYERRASRARAARRKWSEEIQRRRREAGELTPIPDFVCSCPPECAELDQGERPVHAAHCACGCDVD